jgi:hypothetical protein
LWDKPISAARVGAQRVGNARMYRHKTLLMEFGLADMQNATLEVNVSHGQGEWFRDA